MMIKPSTYYQLVYYKRRKLVELVTFALIIIASIISILAIITYLWNKYVIDVVIIGSGPFASYFQFLLEKKGISSQLILPACDYYFGCRVENISPWLRFQQEEVIFPHPSDEEFNQLADKYGLPLSTLKDSWDEIAQRAKIYPPDEKFKTHAEKMGFQHRELYSYHLEKGASKRSCVISIQQEAKLAKVELEKGVLYARLACLVEVNQGNLFEHYQDLNHPQEARIIQIYLSETEEGRVGTFFESEGTSFCYYQNGSLGVTCLSTNTPVRFSLDSGSFFLETSHVSLPETLGLDRLPPRQAQVSHLFLPWKSQEKSPLILDTLNINSTSPERDLLIVMGGLAKMLSDKLSGLFSNGSKRSPLKSDEMVSGLDSQKG